MQGAGGIGVELLQTLDDPAGALEALGRDAATRRSPGRGFLSAHDAVTLHTSRSPSAVPAASRPPDGAKATQLTGAGASPRPSSAPESGSQTRTVRSGPPEATRAPSAEHASAATIWV